MALKKYKPINSSSRKKSVVDYSMLSKIEPQKSLTAPDKRSTGRDNRGHISVRHKGGGAKRLFRLIGNLQNRLNDSAKIVSIEYDPNRSAFISLIEFKNKEKRYILCPEGIKVGDEIIAAEKTEIKTGNRMRIKNIPTGIEIYDIELTPGRGKGQMAKSAGSYASVAAQAEGSGNKAKYVQIKLPSGEIRLVHEECFASIGKVSNPDHSAMRFAKAGRKRHMGIRPSVRGKAMNPRSHPHGGGEGVNPIGLKYPKTPWGKHALGFRTRRRKYSNKFIIKRRK